MVGEKKQVKVEKKEGVAWLIFDNPPVNVFDMDNLLQMRDALVEVNADPEVRVVVITNAGERAFSAGMSVQQHAGAIAGPSVGENEAVFREAIINLDKPVIAAVNGYCLGGAMQILVVCDMVIASERATFGQVEIKVGQMAGGTDMPLVLGKHRAMEFVLSGDRISAHQAESWGLVNKVVPNETFRQEVENFCKRFTANSGAIVSLQRKTMVAVCHKPPEDAAAEVQKIRAKFSKTEDRMEGIQAFREKRPPQWKHR